MDEGKKYRYPGINSFEMGDSNIFFGREEDRVKLADKVELEKSTLLYSRSGLGKSSLLKAALIPELIQRGFQPYYIRLGLYQSESMPLVQQVLRRTVLIDQKQVPVTFLHKFANRTNSLWSVFKAEQIANHPHDKPVVLIFDQFEEVGSYKNHMDNFKQQLAELLYTPIPQAYLEALSDEDLLTEPLTEAELDILYKPLRIKAVFAIRSDQLSVVNNFSDYLPNILKSYYELKPLSLSQAKGAIEEPGKKEGNFITPSFTYHSKAVEKIITALDQKKTGAIDTAQLQILLQYIEQDIVEKRGDTVISAEDLGNLNDVYWNYYRNSLQKLTSEKEAVQELIEDTLITDGRRISYDEALCRKRVSAQTLDLLIKIRLLRQEPNTMGGYNYEISHDSLVEPILKVREERLRIKEEERLRIAFEKQQAEQEQQRKEAAEKQRLEYEINLKEQEKKRKQQRRTLAIVAIAGIISLGFGIWAISESNKSEEAKREAQANYGKAKKLIDAFYFYDGKFALAMKDSLGEKQFYFIDTLGNPVNKLGSWDNAFQFEVTGLAEVDKNVDHFYIDTLGNYYKTAFDIAEMDNSTTALDLRGQENTFTFSDIILEDSNLRVLLLDYSPHIIIPPDIEKLNQLRYLFLENCNIKELPSQIGNLPQLVTLELRNNQLQELPVEISKLQELSYLNLRNNNLERLPEGMGNLKKLTYLSLSNNQLTALPPEMGNLNNLVSLYATNNHLKSIPNRIGNLTKLITLNLYHNQLTTLPKEIGNLESLNTLILDNNDLKILPEQIGNLHNLVSLGLSGIHLTVLPKEIGKLHKLKELYLDNNQLTYLPNEITYLKHLELLFLSDNHLQTLPGEIGKLKLLKELGLGNNDFTAVPKEIGNLKDLTYLNLSGNQLATLPEEIGSLKNLKTLILDNNKIKSLPAIIGNLESLSSLNVSNNQLVTLLEEIGNLKNLTELYLDNNSLETLPSVIGNLTQLTSLHLYHNQLSKLPAQIRDLQNVNSLFLFENRFTSFPPEVTVLRNLTYIDLSQNELSSLPAEIGNLVNLRELYLINNKLTTLPPEMGKLKKLKLLDLSGNPISTTEQQKLRKLLPDCKITF